MSALDRWPWRGVALLAYIVAGALYGAAWLPLAIWCTAIVGACRALLALGR
jgi:hypothetical protein